MRWSEWTELIPDPEQSAEHGGVVRARVLVSGPGRASSLAIQRRLRTFGRRQVPVQRQTRRARPPLRDRLRVALGLFLLALGTLIRGDRHGRD